MCAVIFPFIFPFFLIPRKFRLGEARESAQGAVLHEACPEDPYLFVRGFANVLRFSSYAVRTMKILFFIGFVSLAFWVRGFLSVDADIFSCSRAPGTRLKEGE